MPSAFEKRIKECKYIPPCRLELAERMELFFAGISETNRSAFVRSIIFALSTPAGAQNELSECSHETAQRRKKKHLVNDERKKWARLFTPYKENDYAEMRLVTSYK